MGIDSSQGVELVNSAHRTNDLGAFLLTVLTGGIVMSASVASGFVIQRFVLDRSRPSPHQSAKAGMADELDG